MDGEYASSGASATLQPPPQQQLQPAAADAEVLLEGWMLKLSRGRQWQNRYFVHTSNQILTYSHKKQDPAPRQVFKIRRDAGCEIGDLYVEQRQRGSERESLYCFTMTWSDSTTTSLVGLANNSNFGSSSKLHESFCRDDTSNYGSLHGGPSSPQSRSSSPAPKKGNRLSSVFKAPLRGRKSSLKSETQAALIYDDKGRPESPLRDFASRSMRVRSPAGSVDYDEASMTSIGSPTGQRGRLSWLPGKREKRNSVDSLGQSLPNFHSEPPSGANNTIPSASSTVPAVVSMSDQGTMQDMALPAPPFGGGFDPRPQHVDATESLPLEEMATPRVGNSAFENKKDMSEQEKLHALYYNTQRKEKKEYRKKVVDGTKIAVAATAVAGVSVMTAGVGLGAGLVFLGAAAAAGGTAGAAEAGLKRKSTRNVLTMASASYEVARLWKTTLDACLEAESLHQSTWGQMFVADGRKTTSALLPRDIELKTTRSREALDNSLSEDAKQRPNHIELPKGQSRLFLKHHNLFGESRTEWCPLDGGWATFLAPASHGLRIFREERLLENNSRAPTESCTCPLKSQIILKAAPLDAFLCLMSCARLPKTQSDFPLIPNSGQCASFRLLEHVDDQTDIVHLVFRKLYLFPSWTEPRDFVLFRYWRYEQNGSYVVCYESVDHPSCPPMPGFVRGVMHQVCTIAPTKNAGRRRRTDPILPECSLACEVQVDPKGWVPTRPFPILSNQCYAEAFAVNALMQILDVRDAIENDRFINVSPELESTPQTVSKSREGVSFGQETVGTNDFMNYDLRFASSERFDCADTGTLSTNPPPLDTSKWAEPDANSFLVRGPTYKRNRAKINAGASIGRLVAVDLVAVDKAILSGFSVHPTERIQLALQREKKLKEMGKPSDMPPFIFVVNIVLPGPPVYHSVFYYAVDDMSTIDGSNGTGSSRLCNKFIFGDSDDFRDKTFKLIPQIVEGNFMVRKAVGSTPAIMGTKLQQTYVRNSRYMEVVLNCGSSAVATGVIRLSLGYARTLMIDMGFLLEADDEDFLPEQIFGCVRMKYPDFGSRLRKVVPVVQKERNS